MSPERLKLYLELGYELTITKSGLVLAAIQGCVIHISYKVAAGPHVRNDLW